MIYVLVNSVSVYVEGLSIENVITSGPDTASFIMMNPTIAPASGQDVYVYRDSTSDVLFRGLITSVTKYLLAPNYGTPSSAPFGYQVNAQDYQQLLNQWLIAETYTSKTCKQIIQDFVTNFCDPAFGFTTTHVSTGPTITDARYNYVKVRDAIQELAQIVHFDWYVDENKDIHFFEKETLTAPFVINDSAMKSTIFGFNIAPDYLQVRNRVFVRGGYYLSSNYTESWIADGTGRIWSLGFKPSNVSALTIGGVAATYALDHLNLDDGTYKYFWSYNEKYLRCAENPGTTTTPPNGTTIAITYKYQVPVLVRVDNLASQTAIAALRGGTGIIEHIIRDEAIESNDIAMDVGLADVNQFGNAVISGSFQTYENGFRAGQYIELDVSGFESFDGNYQIQRVTMQSSGPDKILYNIEFATTLYELKDLLNYLIKSQKRVKIRDDELVDLLIMLGETITISESHNLNLNVHPAKWGEFKWGLGTWG